jgi:VanZ family protein
MKHITVLIARLSLPAFWLCVALILYLSLVPGTMRQQTGASSHLEHFMAYAITGAIFVPGARSSMSTLTAAVGLCWLSGAVEIAQLWIPGRTGEVAGFIWSSAGAWLGLLLGHWLWRAMRTLAPLEN